jgi:hypothetical protein
MNGPIFAIDPSSTRTGWAVMQPPERLLQAGLLLPSKTRAASEFRVETMCRDLRELLDEWQPAVVVIEWTSGKVNVRRHGGAGAGLAIYGIAIGALWQTAVIWATSVESCECLARVQCVEENQWTCGTLKQRRMAAVQCQFPEYRNAIDPGGDIADAIGLASWWLKEHTVCKRL